MDVGGHAAGSTVDAGLPNITGDISDLFVGRSFGNTSGVFSASSPDYNTKYSSGSWSGFGGVNFNASRSSSVYGRSKTVQPATYYVNIWQRIS